MRRPRGRGYRRMRDGFDARQEAIDRALRVMRDSEYVGGLSEREAWRMVLAILGSFETHFQSQEGAQGA